MQSLKIKKQQLMAFMVVALRGGVRDRVFGAMVVVGLILLLTTPVVALFSMRQILALATSYSLSIISLMGLLLTLFIAMSLLARDLEQRQVYTICSLPISRATYLLGKFFGFAILLFLAVAILGCFAAGALFALERIHPAERAFAWGHNYIVQHRGHFEFSALGAERGCLSRELQFGSGTLLYPYFSWTERTWNGNKAIWWCSILDTP